MLSSPCLCPFNCSFLTFSLRWLVQDRKDGKNVNNWHWYASLPISFPFGYLTFQYLRSEENMFQWAKERIISLFEGSSILDNDTHHFTVTKVDSMKVRIC